MRKQLITALCATLLASSVLAGCSADEFKYGKAATWTKEGKAMLGTEITEGEFVLYGVKYTFPMTMSDFLDNGWHVDNSISNKNSFLLDAYYTSEEFYLYRDNDSKAYIKVSVYNDTDTGRKIEECMLYSVEIDPAVVEAVFPGGISRISKKADVEKQYTDATSVEGEKSSFDFTAIDGYPSTVTITLNNSLTKVSYRLADAYMGWFSSTDDVAAYIDDTLAVLYHGELDRFTDGTSEDAEAISESYQAYLAETLLYYCNCNSEYLSEETFASFENLALAIMKTSSWEVTVDSFTTETSQGTATLTIHPTNYFTLIDDTIDEVIADFNEKTQDVDLGSLSDEEYAPYEEEYALTLYDALSKKVTEVSASEPVTLTLDIDTNELIFSDSDREIIDDYIMGLYIFNE